MSEFSISNLIGVRFTDHGRSIEEGFDCYGLAIYISKQLGHELKDLWYEKSCAETFTSNAEAMIAANNVAETKELEFGNLIVFFNSKGDMVHIGVILDDELFIHSDLGGVRVTRFEDYYRKKWKVYKWQQ